MAERKHLYWTPCAAHCIDLILEDIGKLPVIRTTLKNSMFMSGYIVSHVGRINMMRKFTGQRNLHRPAQTRFATSFITLSQIFLQRSNLRQMIISDEWQKSIWARDPEARKVSQILLDETYWKNVRYVLRLTSPIVKVLRMVDGDVKPAMGYIYEAMDRAKEAIASGLNHASQKYKKVFEIIDQRWDCQLHQPLHAAGYFLNPEFFYDNLENAYCEEVQTGFLSCLSRLVHDVRVEDEILNKEIEKYKNAQGLFGTPPAIRNRKAIHPGI